MVLIYTFAIVGLFIILYFIINGYISLFVSFSYYLKERKQFLTKKKSTIEKVYFYILIPALREQNVIEKTLKHISSFNYSKNKFEIIVALDKKESSRKKDNLKTKDFINKFILEHKSKNVKFIEYAGSAQKRAYQLNVALEYIKKNNTHQHTFIGVYDADSHPDLDTLKYINYKYTQDNKKVAFQQNMNYLLNSHKIKHNVVLLANAYYQTMWNYLFEINQFITTNRRILANKKSRFPPYCMGHGEFFKLEVLTRINGFSEIGPADGIQIGFTLTKNNIPIYPVPFEDYCESPESLITLYKQHTFWFFGNLTFYRILRSSKFLSIAFLQNCNHLFLAIKWALRPFLVIFVLIIFTMYNALLFWLLIIFVWVYYLSGYLCVINFLNKNTDFKVYKLRLFGLEIPLGVFYKSLGAIHGVYKILKHIIFKKEINYHNKVER